MPQQVFFDHPRCGVWISMVDGRLRLTGEGIGGPAGTHGYDYIVAIDRVHFPTIRSALGAPPESEIIDVMRTHAEPIFMQGETTWLKSIGVPYDFAIWFHVDE